MGLPPPPGAPKPLRWLNFNLCCPSLCVRMVCSLAWSGCMGTSGLHWGHTAQVTVLWPGKQLGESTRESEKVMGLLSTGRT